MKKHYEALDGLRGVAALAVVWLHICETCSFQSKPPNAHLAVDFFFCLSGFVIAHAYGARLSAGMDFWSFARVRLIRLWPLAALGAALGGGVLLTKAMTTHTEPVVNVLLATGLNMILLPSGHLVASHSEAYATNSPLWSLGWELVINAAYALIAPRLSTPKLVATVIAGGGVIVWIGLTHAGLNVGFGWDDSYLGFCRVLYPFSAGVLIHRLPTFPNRLGIVLAGIVGALLLGPAIGPLGELATDLIAFPAVVWIGAGARMDSKTSMFSLWLGELSYPVYVIHHPLMRLMANAAPKVHLTDHVTLTIAGFAIAVGAGWAAYVWYDMPFRRRLTLAIRYLPGTPHGPAESLLRPSQIRLRSAPERSNRRTQ